jgi:superfamily I DNA/RNA helicase
MNFQPTVEQETFIGHTGSAFVRACPGAGKTQTIVERLKRQILSKGVNRQGIAMLSFTNSAVEEFKQRCFKEGVLDDLGFPNFLGTFDSFIWKFIGLPAMGAIPNITPRLMESWDDIYLNLRGNRRISDRGIQLSRFDPITRAFNLKGLRSDIERVITTYHTDYVHEAERRLRLFKNKGLFSTTDARKVISESFADQNFSSSLGLAMKGRFTEVIVDEAQDCNETDISILRWLKDSGVPIIVVCDPGQAIYEFRNSTPERLQEFTSTLPLLTLSGNFRSTPTICKIASTLREEITPDEPLGEFRAIQEPIRLLPYTGGTVCPSVGKRFTRVANELGLPNSEIASLAHDRKSAMRAAGLIPSDDTASTSKRFMIAKATVDFMSPGVGGRFREKALISVMKLILKSEGLLEENNFWREAIDEHNVEERELRRRALEIIGELPSHCEVAQAESWMNKAKQAFGKNVNLAQGNTVNQIFRSTEGWHTPLTESAQQNKTLNYSTIHEAKGHQFLGVLISIKPGGDVFQLWQEREIREEIRVLYVGITRAQRLLGIAFPHSQLEVLQNLLENHQIPNITIN